MRQLLWIGCLESDQEFINKAGKGYKLASAQVSQQNILTGIEKESGLLFDSINGSVLPPYPVYKDRDIAPVEWSHEAGCVDISVGYRNDRYINRINCRKAMLQAVDKWIDTRYSGGELIVFVYSMRSAPMAAAGRIKKRIGNARLILIVTDLPQFMDLGQSRLKAFLKKLDWISIRRMQSNFDGFVLYASKMAEFLKLPWDKWMLMEGSYDVREVKAFNCNKKDKVILYSGKLDKEYGISLLLEAFMDIEDEDAQLWLTGGGNYEKQIRECTEKDSRIKFFGFLASRAKVLKMQNEAMLLINMRLPSEEASSYCFPSKLFEYMATGTPTASFRLEGIPEEYFKYLITIESETKESVKETLLKVLTENPSELKALGAEARGFIVNEKNRYIQAGRIYSFAEKV